MAWSHAASVKGAAAMHAKHKSGNQTAAQLAAERANLAKARAKRHTMRHGTSGARGHRRSTGFKFLHKPPKPYVLGNRGAKMASAGARWNSYRRWVPLGSRRVAYKKKATLSVRKPTGRNPRFHARIGPGGYLRRTSWQQSRGHKMKKVLRKRRPKQLRVSHYSYRRRRITPR